MITVPPIYSQDEQQISNDLMPIEKRKPVWLAWFASLLTPLQWLHDLIYTSYYGGSNAALWVTSTNYVYGDRVKDIDYKVYELMNVNGLTPSTVAPHLDPANWFEVLDTFVGVGERVKYTGQLSMLEYILNYYFSVGSVSLPWIRTNAAGTSFINPSRSTQIYITTGTISNGFWLSNGNSQPLTSYMSNVNVAQRNFMGNNPSYNPNTFTIYVPSAVATAITGNQPTGITYDVVIRAIVDKYVQAGKVYNITTY